MYSITTELKIHVFDSLVESIRPGRSIQMDLNRFFPSLLSTYYLVLTKKVLFWGSYCQVLVMDTKLYPVCPVMFTLGVIISFCTVRDYEITVNTVQYPVW